MGRNTVDSLHSEIRGQFDVMDKLVEEIESLRKQNNPAAIEQAQRLADILEKLSEKASRMDEIVRRVA